MRGPQWSLRTEPRPKARQQLPRTKLRGRFAGLDDSPARPHAPRREPDPANGLEARNLVIEGDTSAEAAAYKGGRTLSWLTVRQRDYRVEERGWNTQ